VRGSAVSIDHYENFPVASRLVPEHLRGAVVAIYRFARAADDIADEGDASDAQRLADLGAFGAQLDRIAAGERPGEPPFNDLADTIRKHQLPLVCFHDLLSAFAQDVTQKRYADFAQLLDYCNRSANPVGRLLLHLYKTATTENLQRADAICSGLQLANFWQDVTVDWAKGRVYVPQEDLRRFGVSEAQIAEGRFDANWSRLLGFEVARTRAMLHGGRPLAAALPLRLRLELRMVVAGGLRILAKLDATGGNVFHRRPKLHAFDWIRMAGAALAPR
jgi:squalene synthase HpnC